MKPPKDIERLYLDFDSFFASAEQHFNPSLRGRAVGVVPLDARNTGCIAMSREAKALGLKSGATIDEGRALIPDIVYVVARHDVYVRLHRRIVDVVNTCVPVADVRSIDEMVCHLKPSEARQGQALADHIKQALRDEFSEVLTCSIGMAPTELLAKTAAETSKPDGFRMIRASDMPAALESLPLEKLPGISEGIAARLAAAGISDVPALWDIAPKQARALWGNVEGERFWAGLHGYPSERPATRKRMFGHSRMLPQDWRDPARVALCARELTLSATRRLRRADMRATRMTVSLRGGGYRGRSRRRADDKRWTSERGFPPARDDQTMFAALSDLLEKAEREISFRPRSVSVMLHGLEGTADATGDLFAGTCQGAAKRRRWEEVGHVLDRLRERHGPKALSLGPRCEVPGGYLGAKIAFGRIPEDADFGSAPVADGSTHFLSF